MNFQSGERLRIRVKEASGQPFESFSFSVPYVMSLDDIALQFARTIQPGMVVEIVQGKSKWSFRKTTHAGLNSVERVRAGAKTPPRRYQVVLHDPKDPWNEKKFKVHSSHSTLPEAEAAMMALPSNLASRSAVFDSKNDAVSTTHAYAATVRRMKGRL